MIQNNRIYSIDVFRALTMLLMIFVNDLWSLKNIPSWLEHAESTQDFLGLADVVFPCFLFIVGMSVPYAISNRVKKGDNQIQIIQHIALRTLALLIMGIFTVNISDLNETASGFSKETLQILMVLGFLLIWNDYPNSDTVSNRIFLGLKILGIALLGGLAYFFKAGEEDNLVGMTIQWWGILGLIGWTYFTVSLLFLFTSKFNYSAILFFVFFNAFCIAGHSGFLRLLFPSGPNDWILANGAFFAFAYAGIIASEALKRNSLENGRQLKLVYRFIAWGIALIIGGLLLRHHFIISKIQATPPWVCICTGIAFISFSIVFYLVDIKGKVAWFSIIKIAGTSTLTCYLIPYWYYSIAELSGISLPGFMKDGFLGLVKSMAYAFLVIGIAYLLSKIKIKLKI